MPGFTITVGTVPANIIVSKLRPDIIIVNTKKTFPRMDITVTSPALRLVHVFWSLQTPTNEFLRYFPPSKPNQVTQNSDLIKIAILSSYTIWNALHKQSWRPRTNLTSTAIALSLLFLHALCCNYNFVALFLSFPAPHHGHIYWWPWYMIWAFVYNLFLLAVFVYIANKDWTIHTLISG